MTQLSAEKEVDLLKATFKKNEALLKLMRALWFGFELSNSEKDTIRGTFQSEDLRTAVRRKVYALMGDDAPIGSVPDFWLNIQDNQIIGAGRDAIYQVVTSKGLLLKMFQRAIALLEDPDGEKNDLNFDASFTGTDELQTKLLARNLYIRAMETGLHLINQIANQPEPETPAQTAKKIAKNSSK